MKKNKQKVTQAYKDIVKDLFFNGIKIPIIAKQLGFKDSAIRIYVNSRATKTYIKDGVRYRRCISCKLYKEESTYIDNGGGYFKSECRFCHNRISSNRYIYRNNINDGVNKERRDKHRKKHGWKINAIRVYKRKVKLIINN